MTWLLFIFDKLPYLLSGVSFALFILSDKQNKHYSYFFMFLTLLSRS